MNDYQHLDPQTATIEDLPQDLKQQLPIGAQEVFLAGFKRVAIASESDTENLLERATEAGWDAVRKDYERASDGTWYYGTRLGYETPEGRRPI